MKNTGLVTLAVTSTLMTGCASVNNAMTETLEFFKHGGDLCLV